MRRRCVHLSLHVAYILMCFGCPCMFMYMCVCVVGAHICSTKQISYIGASGDRPKEICQFRRRFLHVWLWFHIPRDSHIVWCCVNFGATRETFFCRASRHSLSLSFVPTYMCCVWFVLLLSSCDVMWIDYTRARCVRFLFFAVGLWTPCVCSSYGVLKDRLFSKWQKKNHFNWSRNPWPPINCVYCGYCRSFIN